MLAARLTAQLLAGRPAATVDGVVERLLAVQAQDPRGARLAVRARSQGLVAGDVDRALDAGELVVSWLNRGTLHLVRAEDHAWLHALTTPQLRTSNLARLRQEGVAPEQAERAVGLVQRELGEGPKTRAELRDVLVTAGVPVGGQALVHLLFLATLRGVCVRGPMRGKEQAFVLARDWLPKPASVDRDQALAELGRRYLLGHAPAEAADLAKWAGTTLGDARRALAGAQAPRRRTAPVPAVTLLGPFDELLMGWASRDLVVGGRDAVITRNGIFSPVLLVDGRAAGTWRLNRGRVDLRPFTALPAEAQDAVAAEVADVERFVAG